MKLLELLASATPNSDRVTFQRAINVVMEKWPRVRFFNDDHLAELQTALATFELQRNQEINAAHNRHTGPRIQ